MRLRATLVVEYAADPEDYSGVDGRNPSPGEMAIMDEDSEDPIALLANADWVSFTVEPVE